MKINEHLPGGSKTKRFITLPDVYFERPLGDKTKQSKGNGRKKYIKHACTSTLAAAVSDQRVEYDFVSGKLERENGLGDCLIPSCLILYYRDLQQI